MRKSKKEWNPENDKLLGTDTDKAIAQQLKTHLYCVYNRRKELSILPHRGGLKWTPEMDSLLHTMSERGVAKRLGIDASTVRRRKRIKSIKGKMSITRSIEQIQTDYASVGYNQRALARLYKVSPQRAGQLVQRVKRVELVNA